MASIPAPVSSAPSVNQTVVTGGPAHGVAPVAAPVAAPVTGMRSAAVPLGLWANSSVAADYSWLKTHVLLLLLVVGLTVGGIYAVESLVARHDATNAARSQAALEVVVQSNKALQAQAAVQFAELQQQVVSLEKENTALSAGRATRASQTAAQQRTDAALTPVAAAQRIQQLVPNQGTPVPNADTSVTLPPQLTEAVIQELDTLPQLQADVNDLTLELTNEGTVITDLKTELATDATIIAGQQIQLTDLAKADKDQISALKSQARRSKLKWFVVGFVAGAAVREFIKIGTGL